MSSLPQINALNLRFISPIRSVLAIEQRARPLRHRWNQNRRQLEGLNLVPGTDEQWNIVLAEPCHNLNQATKKKDEAVKPLAFFSSPPTMPLLGNPISKMAVAVFSPKAPSSPSWIIFSFLDLRMMLKKETRNGNKDCGNLSLQPGGVGAWSGLITYMVL